MSGIEVALAAASTAMSVLGAVQQGNAQAAASKYNAAVNMRNATVAQQQAAADEARQRRVAMQQIGAERAGYGASGVSLEGSPLDVLEQSATNAELDALNIRYNGALKAQGYQSNAQLDRMNARSARTAGYIGAASSLLTGGSKTYAAGQKAGYWE